jgi:prefoldin subunit 5
MAPVTAPELLHLLEEPATRENVKRLLGLPTEAVAEALDGMREGMRDLSTAQARTDASLAELSREVTGLSKEVTGLSKEVTRLAEAQARTDASLAELSKEVGELAQAQARTDQSIHALRHEVGALSDNVGFGLEELASILLPGWLEREEGVTVRRLGRRHFQTSAGDEEVDVYADGDRAGAVVPVIGEVKSRIYSGDVKKYAAKVERIAETLLQKPLGVMFGFVVHPAANDVARELGLRLIASRPTI